MGPRRSFWVLYSVFFVMVMLVSVRSDRELSARKIQCPKSNCPDDTSIIWVKAVATDNSTIHYLWTTYPVPTIVLAYTTVLNVVPVINWSNLTNDSSHHSGVRFNGSMNYVFGFAVPLLYEYDDDADNADLNDNTYMVVHKFTEHTKWKMDLDESASQVKFTANDSIIFKFRAFSSKDHGSKLPHEMHTADSSSFSLTLDHVNLTTNNTRFAVEVNYIVKDNDMPEISVEKNFDDEYTPAVFKIVYGKVVGRYGKTYSQWKPIAYTKAELGRKFQTKASAGSVTKVFNRPWNIGEVVMKNTAQVYGLNVSFGLTKDGFYQKNMYLTWSGIIGYGDPAKESVSFLVILIISIGLGLPLAIILFGGTYYQIRKHYRKSKANASYGRIN